MDESGAARLAGYRRQLAQIIIRWGHERRDEPFELSSGGWSHDYVDGKRAIARGGRLELVGEAVAALAADAGIVFEAVGGLTMGADPIAVAVAIACDADWFSVRKQPKPHGKQKRIEGAELAPATPVLIVDDVVTSGRSIIEGLDAVEQMGAKVVLATTLVDRGDSARSLIESRGIRYEPLLTYRDLNIEPVGQALT